MLSASLNKTGPSLHYLTSIYIHTLNTFYLWLYGVRHMVKDHEIATNMLPPHGLLFLISSKGSFICNIPHIGFPTTASCEALAGKRNSSTGPP